MPNTDFSNAVIIVGAGLSGGSCAMTVLENGGTVILVEKEKKLGGNSVRASSGINASGTRHQKDQNVPDSNELFCKDTAYSMFKDINAKPTPLVETLCNESSDGVHWLEDHKLHLPVLSQCGGHSAPRTHRPTSGAAGGYITLGLLRGVRKYEKTGQCKIYKKSRMTGLVRESGKVVGLTIENTQNGNKETLRGACVVLATGGFCFNKNLLREYAPHYANLPTTNGPWTQGQGMEVARSIGADLVDMECVQVHPTGFIDPLKPNEHEKILAAECLRASGALLINEKGRRFVNELGHRDDVTSAERGQVGVIRLILNERSIEFGKVQPHVRMYREFFKVLKEYKNGYELAKSMNIDVQNLIDTFDVYNQAAKKGWCPSGKVRFPGAPYDINKKLTVGFVTPVLHYVMGGIKINPRAQVIDTKGTVIKGLYACGETTGGVHGRNRLAGNSLVDCVVYGRVAGRNASQYVGLRRSKL